MSETSDENPPRLDVRVLRQQTCIYGLCGREMGGSGVWVLVCCAINYCCFDGKVKLFVSFFTTSTSNCHHHNHHTIATPHHTTPHYTAPQHTTLHHTTLHPTPPHHTTSHHTTPHHTTSHHATPHHTTYGFRNGSFCVNLLPKDPVWTSRLSTVRHVRVCEHHKPKTP